MIATRRLVLREWRDGDASAHHAMCNDPRIAAMLGSKPDLADSKAVVVHQNALLAADGRCFWAMELREDRSFSGWCGIKPGHGPIAGEAEIGWSVRPDMWRRGLAHEAASAVLDWVWRNTDLARVVAITAAINRPSRGLMERLGMIRVTDGDFDHPDLAAGDPLRPHIFYRIGRPV